MVISKVKHLSSERVIVLQFLVEIITIKKWNDVDKIESEILKFAFFIPKNWLLNKEQLLSL